MAPIYSKTGCLTCRRRRKKCGEQQPMCHACSRLGLPCHYGRDKVAYSRQPVSFQICVFNLQSPQIQTNLLPAAHLRSHDSSILARVPSALLGFFSPTLGPAGRDAKGLMQLVLVDTTVRDAVVSCFSTILSAQHSQLGHLNRLSLVSALHSVRSQLSDPKTSVEQLTLLQIAIQYLGLIDSGGPQQTADPATHWIALAMLIGQVAEKYPRRHCPLPQNVQILLVEAAVYNMTMLTPFTKDIEAYNVVWRKSHIYPLLLHINPEGKHRLSKSPLLGGQYELWYLAYEVISLGRSATNSRPSELVISQKKEKIKQIRSNLDDFYAMSQNATPVEKQHMSEMYYLHCNALLIAFTALEKISLAREQEIKSLLTDAIQRFLEWELIPVAYAPATWALYILACTITDQEDWDKLNAKISQLELQMDAGHLSRLESVLAQVKLARATLHDELEQINVVGTKPHPRLPGLLFLLHQPEGVLHDWRAKSPWENCGITDAVYADTKLALNFSSCPRS